MTEHISYTVPAEGPSLQSLKTEWFSAQIALAVSLVLSLAVFGWWTYSHRTVVPGMIVDAGSGDASDVQDQMDQVVASGQTSKEGFMLCRLAIGTAQAFGVVPSTIKYAGGPSTSNISGRYVCAAQDQQTVRYLVTVDLACKNLDDMRCASLVSVAKADGSVLYHRQENAGAAPASAPDAAAPAPTDGAAPADGSAAPADQGAPDSSGAIDGAGGAVDATGGGAPPQ